MEFQKEYRELFAIKEKLLGKSEIINDEKLKSYLEIKTDYVIGYLDNMHTTFDEFHYRRTAPFYRKILHILKHKVLKG